MFAVTKRHAETLAQMFDDEFADQKPSPEIRYADYVGLRQRARRTRRRHGQDQAVQEGSRFRGSWSR